MVQMETQLQSIFEEVVVSGRARGPGRRRRQAGAGAAGPGSALHHSPPRLGGEARDPQTAERLPVLEPQRRGDGGARSAAAREEDSPALPPVLGSRRPRLCILLHLTHSVSFGLFVLQKTEIIEEAFPG